MVDITPMGEDTDGMTISQLLRTHLDIGGARELADRVGVTEATISRWKDGHVIPRDQMAEPLAHALGEPVEFVAAAIVAARLRRPDHLADRITTAELDRRLRAVELEQRKISRQVAEILRAVHHPPPAEPRG